jgi:hypothetical protein
MVHFGEGLDWIDSFYLSDVTTVAYGDYAWSTMEGRLFAAEAISQHRKRFNNSISTWPF